MSGQQLYSFRAMHKIIGHGHIRTDGVRYRLTVPVGGISRDPQEGSMVTVSSQSLPMMRRKGSYRLRRPSRYKTSWSSGGGGSGSQNIPPNPHGSPNSLMQAAVARLDLPRPHLVYIGSTGSGRIRPQASPQGPLPLPPVPTQNPTSRPQRPRRLLDPSVPVRVPPSTSSSSSSGLPSSATPPALPFQPTPAPVPLSNLNEEAIPTVSSRQYAANRPRLRHHSRRKSCLQKPLGCEVGCAGACLPGWGAFRALLAATLAAATTYGCLLFINAYLDYVYNREAMRNLLVLIVITAGLFAITRICRIRVLVRLFNPDGLRLQYRAGSSSPLFVTRRDGRQLCRPIRCGSGRHVPTSRSGGVETDGGDADIEDDPDIEQGRSLVPANNDVPTAATDDDDDDGGIGVTDIAGAGVGSPGADPAASVATPPPPPYATVVGGSSSPPPSYDKVVH